MIIKKILIYFAFFSCASSNKITAVTDPSHAYVFVSFCKAGTTSMVFGEYWREKNNSENKNKISEDQLTKLKDVLKDLKWKKHCQKKITRIEKGLDLCILDRCYCFVITSDRVINITQGIESYLTSEQRSRILKAVDLSSWHL